MQVSPTSLKPCGPMSAMYTAAAMVHRPDAVPTQSLPWSREP